MPWTGGSLRYRRGRCMLSLPSSPFCLFVVISTTPFAPLAPYKAPADASFRTDMDSMSLLLMELRSPSNGTPSTTIRGEFDAFIEPNPLILSSAPLPGWPPPDVAMTPATCPSIILVMSVVVLLLNRSPFTVSAEPVNDSFFAVPYATTSTSSRTSLSAYRVTSMTSASATVISRGAIPRKEN